MAEKTVRVAPPNTLIVRETDVDWLEFSEGGIEEVLGYLVLAANIDPERETLTYDIRPVSIEIGGQYTESINAAVTHLPRTSTQRVSQMNIVSTSELEELRARGVNVVIEPREE